MAICLTAGDEGIIETAALNNSSSILKKFLMDFDMGSILPPTMKSLNSEKMDS